MTKYKGAYKTLNDKDSNHPKEHKIFNINSTIYLTIGLILFLFISTYNILNQGLLRFRPAVKGPTFPLNCNLLVSVVLTFLAYIGMVYSITKGLSRKYAIRNFLIWLSSIFVWYVGTYIFFMHSFVADLGQAGITIAVVTLILLILSTIDFFKISQKQLYNQSEKNKESSNTVLTQLNSIDKRLTLFYLTTSFILVLYPMLLTSIVDISQRSSEFKSSGQEIFYMLSIGIICSFAYFIYRTLNKQLEKNYS